MMRFVSFPRALAAAGAIWNTPECQFVTRPTVRLVITTCSYKSRTSCRSSQADVCAKIFVPFWIVRVTWHAPTPAPSKRKYLFVPSKKSGENRKGWLAETLPRDDQQDRFVSVWLAMLVSLR